MYDFHYNYIKKKYEQNVQLLFTDLDSKHQPINQSTINTEDAYQDMIKDKHLFDTSEYDSEHLLYSTENKKVPGKMKDKTHGIPIQ